MMHTDIELNQKNKNLIWQFWQKLESIKADNTSLIDSANACMAENVICLGPDPINDFTGPTAFIEKFWLPLKASFSDLKRETFIFYGGVSNGRKDGDISKDGEYWVTGTGIFSGIFEKEYLGIPPSGKQTKIRWGDFYKINDGKITAVYYLLDFVDLMQQAGFDVLSPSLGKDMVYLPPVEGDGVLLDACDPDQSHYTLAHMRRFIYEGLNKYDESNLESMGMADFFDPEVTWYGPGGIGACYGLKEFEDFHQKLWLHAFPDREVQDLNSLFAEGNYSGGPGWAGVLATHAGEYKGVAATNNHIAVNGLDWWKRDGEKLIENWVFVDMVHLFRQFGVDLFARMKKQTGDTDKL